MDKQPLITVEKLSQKNREALLFAHVSFNVFPREFVSLKGPSGCGKTTLLRILAGLLTPTSGKVFIQGKLANAPQCIIPPHARHISLLFQDLALWPHMKGIDQLKFVWESAEKNDFEKQADAVCSAVSFPTSLLKLYPSQLSRGEQQRLALARALIAKPQILLLDEPLTALDQQLRKQFVAFLQKIKQDKQMTVIIVSHDLMTDVIGFDREILYEKTTFRERVKTNR